jgi:hypothetical protein
MVSIVFRSVRRSVYYSPIDETWGWQLIPNLQSPRHRVNCSAIPVVYCVNCSLVSKTCCQLFSLSSSSYVNCPQSPRLVVNCSPVSKTCCQLFPNSFWHGDNGPQSPWKGVNFTSFSVILSADYPSSRWVSWIHSSVLPVPLVARAVSETRSLMRQISFLVSISLIRCQQVVLTKNSPPPPRAQKYMYKYSTAV